MCCPERWKSWGACALAFASSGDEDLKRNGDLMVAELAKDDKGILPAIAKATTDIAALPNGWAWVPVTRDRVVVSDIAWARTSRWRPQLASLWPAIAEVERVLVKGTAAQAHLIAGWLRSRLHREIALEHEEADELRSVAVDGEVSPIGLLEPVSAGSEVHFVAAISGGGSGAFYAYTTYMQKFLVNTAGWTRAAARSRFPERTRRSISR